MKLPAESYIDAVSNLIIDHWSSIRCGSYTSEWVAKAVGIKVPSSNRLLWGPMWFDLFRPVAPSDMRKLFKTRGMETVEMHFDEVSDEDRLFWIKNEIAINKRPPVLLIRARSLHWLAIGGYSDLKRMFYVYDSWIGTESFNINFPIGNAEMSYDQLLDEWKGRWFFQYVAIVVTNVQVRDLRQEKVQYVLDAYARGDLVDKQALGIMKRPKFPTIGDMAIHR